MAKSSVADAMKKMGFTEVQDLSPKKAVVSVLGFEKTGKSSFMMTLPRPMAIFNFDQGLERVKEREAQEGVYTKTYVVPKLDGDASAGVSPLYMGLWEKFLADVDLVMAAGVKSIGIDTATAAWELCRLAFLGRLTKVKPHHYGPPNASWKSFMMQLRNGPANVCLLHKGSFEYQTVMTKDGKPILDKNGEKQEVKTTNVVRKGQSEVGFDVDIECGLRVETVEKDGKKRKRHEMEIIVNGFDRGVEGEVLYGPLINFQNLMAMCVKGTTEEDWE